MRLAPELLRTPGCVVETTTIEPSASIDEPTGEEMALDGGETAMVEDEQPAEYEPVAADSHPIAAE